MNAAAFHFHLQQTGARMARRYAALQDDVSTTGAASAGRGRP